MWNYKSKFPLLGIGIDAEEILRFKKWSDDIEMLPKLIYSPQEHEFFSSTKNPILAICASFCFKEALFKSISQPYNFNTCSLFYDPLKDRQNNFIPQKQLNDFGIDHFIIKTNRPNSSVICIVAYCFSRMDLMKYE